MGTSKISDQTSLGTPARTIRTPAFRISEIWSIDSPLCKSENRIDGIIYENISVSRGRRKGQLEHIGASCGDFLDRTFQFIEDVAPTLSKSFPPYLFLEGRKTGGQRRIAPRY